MFNTIDVGTNEMQCKPCHVIFKWTPWFLQRGIQFSRPCIIFTTLSNIFPKILPNNMMRKLSLLLAAVCTCVLAHAQYCGFDKAHRQLLSNSNDYSSKVQAMNNDIASLISNNPNALIINTSGGPVYDIPVVIHVMHTGGAVGTIYNPSDATLQGMITYLNQAYQATYASYPNTSNGGTYFPVQFTLAKRDANCNSTSTGIDRVNAVSLLTAIYGSAKGTAYSTYGVRHSGTNGIGEDTLKALANWNHHDYYNIWVVNKIDSNDGTFGTFVAGYAYFPGASYVYDGTIMLATQAVAGSITLPHEIGHAFSLYHVFEGDDPGNTGAATTCPTNANCNTDGDRVCDTDPEKRSTFNCPSSTTTNLCTGNPYGFLPHNFMDYSSCQDRFTSGQKTRWLNALNNTAVANTRYSLLTSLGAQTLGTQPSSPTCVPTAFNAFTSTDGGVFYTKITDASSNILMYASSDGGYVSDGKLAYVDRACWQRADVTAGQTYTISIQSGQGAEKVRVYVDYNNDGFFNTSTELVYSHDGTTSFEVHTGSFTIPASPAVTCQPIRIRVVADNSISAPGPCTAYTAGQAEDYSLLIKPSPNATLTLSQTTGSNPSCNGSTIGFTASYTGTPTSPTVKLYVNGTQVASGATSATYSSSSFNNGDVVNAKLFFTGSCGADSITSANITVSRSSTVTPSVSLSLSAGTNPGCTGQSITMKATPTNGGSGPTYAWYRNGSVITGATSSTYTVTPNCNDSFYVVMTSNSACVSTTTATSNPGIKYICGPQTVAVSIAVTGGNNPTCSGRTVTFSATPTNGGTAPTYQWYINGTSVTGATGISFSTNVLNNGDSVYVVMSSNSPCAATPTAKSPAIYMSVVPTVTPTVTKSITKGTNPGCIGDTLQFTATTANAGSSPTYRWFLNGAATTNTTAVFTLPTGGTTGDKVWVRIVASNPASSCYTRDTAYSDTTTLDRRPRPSTPIISFIGHQLVSDSSNVQWYGPAGLIPGATGPTYTPSVFGDYYAVIINPLCGNGASNVLTISPMAVGNYNLTGVKFFPNPTTGMLTITWNAAATTRITVYTAAGKALMHEMATLATRKDVDLSTLPSGVYFVLLQDENGKSGTIRVTVAH
jgi:hypothetical protein